MSRGRESRDDFVRRVVEEKREQYPQLREALTWETLREVAEAEGVMVAAAPIERPATLLGFDGHWCILVDSRQPRRHTHYAAHELGHLWVHVDRGATDRFECCYHMDTEWANDAREDEAELVATMLLLGEPPVVRKRRRAPGTPPDFVPPTFSPKVAPPPRSAPDAEQLSLMEDQLSYHLRRARQRSRQVRRLAPGDLQARSALPRVEHGAQGKVYYRDSTGVLWRVYDTQVVLGRRWIMPLESIHATHRVFVPEEAETPRRWYAIRRGELREIDVRHLERQFYEAISGGEGNP